MTFKSFLLGSAAALLTVGGAEAADVSFPVAEPVTYVKVCDAFGTGYFYQPGTDTCIKIGGYVRFDVKIGDGIGSAPYYSTSYYNSAGATTTTSYYVSYSSSTIPVYVTSGGTTVGSWGSTASSLVTYGSTTRFFDFYSVGDDDNHEFVTEAAINVTARTQTELGLLLSYIQFLGNTSGEANSANGGIDLDEAYLSLGPLLAGYTGSTFDPGGGYGIYGLDRSDTTADQVRLSWAFGGFGLMVSAEDYQDRVNDGKNIDFSGAAYDNEGPTGRIPDLVAALTATWGGVDAKVAFGWGERWSDGFWGSPGNFNTWGVNGRVEINLDALAAGDRLKLIAGYAQDGGDWVGLNSSEPGSYWTAGAFFKGVLSPTLWFDLGGLWTQAPSNTLIEATGGLTYAPVPGFTAGAAVLWTRVDSDNNMKDNDSWEGKIRLQRNF